MHLRHSLHRPAGVDSVRQGDLWLRVPLTVVWIMVAVVLIGLGPAVFSALQLGGDEHFELTKAWLWAEGIQLYDPLWNDQPPLLTVLLGSLFRVFGPDIAVARALAVGFGLALLAGTTVTVTHTAGPFAAAWATLALFSAPEVFNLSVSVMLEVPTFAVALWALWPVHRWRQAVAAIQPVKSRTPRSDSGVAGLLSFPGHGTQFSAWLPAWHWPLLSGALLGAALQIKLTAAIVAPALVIEWLGRPEGPRRPPELRQRLAAIGIGATGLLGTYVGLALWAGHVPWKVLWNSHFSAAIRAAAADDPQAFPHWCLQRDYTDVLLTAGMAVLVLVWQRQWRVLRFPLIWLGTAAVVHSVHRPWWGFYFLHFAVPLAWLSGCGGAALFRQAHLHLGETRWRSRRPGILWLSGAAAALSALLTFGGERLWQTAQEMLQRTRVKDSGMVTQMRRFREQTRWVYTRETIFPFHAGLRVIPELAVLPSKRFWSGQMYPEQIWDTVMRYQPEQVLLNSGELTPTARFYLDHHYEPVDQDGGNMLFVRKELLSLGR